MLRLAYALVFITRQANKNSVAALAGLIEADAAFRTLALCFLRDEADLPARFKVLLGQYERLVVACSYCTPDAARVERLIERLKPMAATSACATRWVAGGPHPSGDPASALRMGFDVVVIGEAEATFPALLSCLLEDRSVASIKGLAYLREGQMVCTGRAPRIERLDDYPPFAPRHHRFGPIEITRGCPFACRFCQTTFLFGGRLRHRSPEVVAEWARVARNGGIPFMRFVAPNALAYGSVDGRTANLAAVEQLLLAVRKVMGPAQVYLGSFPSEVRPEMVTEEAIRLLARLAANRHITIGAQSGSPRLLDLVHRGHTVDDVYRACEIVLRHGLVPQVDVIFGLPGEDACDRALTMRLIEDVVGKGARVRTHAFMPLAGTPLAAAAPGAIDKATDQLLGRLARLGRQHGARHTP